MKKIINLYKSIGLTPLEAINEYKKRNSEYKNKKTSYPGRLDPMAEGVLLVLIGDENKKMRNYMKLDKEYLAEILFGFSSDSHDILGIPNKGEKIIIEIKKLKKKIKNFKGTYNQKIPVYSSFKIKGKPLFYYARNNKLNEIEIPEIKIKIKNIIIKSIYEISSSRLLKEIIKKINLVKGDFRQSTIKKKWNYLLREKERFVIVKILINCSSGTYIRAIADDLGKDFGGGILFNLKRTRVGKYTIKDSMRI